MIKSDDVIVEVHMITHKQTQAIDIYNIKRKQHVMILATKALFEISINRNAQIFESQVCIRIEKVQEVHVFDQNGHLN